MRDDAVPQRVPVAWRAVLPAGGTVLVVLAVLAQRYGYHRDELYFRILPPAWNYLDQPPLTPFLVRTISGLVDEAWAIRIPAMLSLAAAVVLVAHVTRELGGGPAAQALSSWGLAFTSIPLTFGHILLTASLDLVVWLAVGLLAIRALLRDPRWWIAVGLITGLSTFNKLLVVYLVAGLVAGLVLVGPRTTFRNRWFWSGVALAMALAVPAIAYQVGNHWPQVQMGAALAYNNAGEVRPQAVPFLALLLGPPLVPIWVAGCVALWRRTGWRALRCVPVALLVVVIATIVGGAQVYYPVGVLTLVWAAGCVPTIDWMRRGRRTVRRGLLIGAVALNCVVTAVISLPILPVGVVAASPIPGINQTVGDQIGWPAYAAQVRTVADTLSADERSHAVVIASNYGEAGALDRFGPAAALPPVVSGHNALGLVPLPVTDVRVAVVVGRQVDLAAQVFGSCRTVLLLDAGVDVDNEEQGAPVALCRDPIGGFEAVWPRFRHLD